jgi:hypothetical protein
MFKQGPIPAFVHGVIEYLAAILLIAAPFLFSFDEDTATAVSIVAGVLLIVLTSFTALPTGMVKSIPVHAHAIFDYVLAALLIAAPFLFSFTDDGAATAFFIVLGVAHLLLTIATRFVSEARPPRQRQAE